MHYKRGRSRYSRVHGASIDQYYQRHNGDIIVALDGHNVTKASDFISYIDEHKNVNDSLNLVIYRLGEGDQYERTPKVMAVIRPILTWLHLLQS